MTDGTVEKAEGIRREVQAAMREGGLSQTAVGREAGVSVAVLNQWLLGKYKGDDENATATMEKWLDGYRSRTSGDMRLPAPPEYVETPTARKILGAFEYARMAGDVVVVYGGAGLGKTRTARHYSESHNNVWLVTMTPALRTAASALSVIGDALGIREYISRASQLQKAVVERMRGTYGLLILDEAQHMTLSGLDQVRSLHDATDVGVAMLGNETVYGRMTGGTRAAYLDRLFSRVGMRAHLRTPLKEDIGALARAWGIEGDNGRIRLLREIAAKPGALRIMTKVLRLASLRAMRRGEAVNETDIQDAWIKLGGNGDE